MSKIDRPENWKADLGNENPHSFERVETRALGKKSFSDFCL